MKSWIQLAQQQSKIFELATPLTIGETYTISMNSNEPFMISVGDVFVGETVDGSLEFIATNSGDVMITSHGDISMEFEIKLELGSQTEWSPAPEDAYGLDLPNGAYHIQGGNSFSKTVEEGVQASVHAYAWSNITLNGEPLPINDIERYREDFNKIEFTGTNLDFIASDPVISTDSLIEYRSQSYEQHSTISPISQVQVYWDDVSAFEAGDDTMSTIIINTPWATRNSTDYIYSVLGGYQYKPTQGSQVYADPAIQLGDTFSYGDTDQLVASVIWHFDGSVTGDFNAPQNNDSNLDDPRETLIKNEFKKKISLGDSYQGVTIDRENGIQMLLSPDGTDANATGRFYADLKRGLAFQYRGSPSGSWQDFLYFDYPSKSFKINLSSDDLYKSWFAYSENANGVPFTTDPQPNSRYIGTASAIDRPTLASDYKWILIKGADGIDGTDGRQPFIAYADNDTGTENFSITDNKRKFQGIYIGHPPQSTTPSMYTWSESTWGNAQEIAQLDDRTVVLELGLDGISASVENIHNGNIITGLNGDLGYMGWTGGSDSVFTGRIYVDVYRTYEHGFEIIEDDKSLSGFNIEFINYGYDISPFGYVIPDIQYSYRARVINFKPMSIDVLEYLEDRTLNKTTNFEFSTVSEYIDLTLDLQSDTMYVRLKFNHDNARWNDPITLTEQIFNRGLPKNFFESATNAMIYSQTTRTQLSDRIDDVVSTVEVIDGEVFINRTNITQLGNEIELKVNVDGVISAINLTSEQAKILANHISLEGLTTINGNFKVLPNGDVEFINAKGTNVDITGKVTATSGKVGGFTINGNTLTGSDLRIEPFGLYFNNSAAIGSSGSYNSSNQAIELRGLNVIVGHGDSEYASFLVPFLSGNASLGQSSKRWSEAYLNNQPNVSSDIRYKSDIQDIDPLLVEIIGREVKPKQYRTQFDDKWHFGYIAQDVERALYKYCGNDKEKFAVLSKDESYMSLLYGELNVIIEAYNRSVNNQLEERIKALEGAINERTSNSK